jgi:polysaccharide deacetylase family protein (PEP-CTERM system associated)
MIPAQTSSVDRQTSSTPEDQEGNRHSRLSGQRSARPAREASRAKKATTDVVNAMTIDVEDYFHVSVFDGLVPRDRWKTLESRVCANTERLLGVFDEAGVTATFFVLGWVAEQYPALVARIAAMGHEVASHGYSHRLIYDQTPAAFREDVRRAKALLESATGCRVDGFRAPSYSITPTTLWAIDVLIEEDYRYDASIFPIRHDRYGIPLSPRHPYVLSRDSGSLVEVPASTVRLASLNLPVAGGGYFRLLPYSWTRWGISRINVRERRPAIFYLHPWEVDPGQPRLEAGLLGRFRHYRNLDKTEGRLRRLLHEFRFAPLRQILAGAQADAPVHAQTALPYLW